MRLNLLRSGWLQFNVHYYDRIKFKYGYDDEASVQALQQLTEIAVESVPREVENYMFLNQLKFNPDAIKNEVQQVPLHIMQSFMQEKNQALIDQAIESIPRCSVEQITQMIDKRQVIDWNVETVKKLYKEVSSVFDQPQEEDSSVIKNEEQQEIIQTPEKTEDI